MIEFVQIPDSGISQIQVYFVPNSIPEGEILGESSRHHEAEIKEKGIEFSGPQGPLNGALSVAEPIMEVEVKDGEVSVKEAVSE